MIKVICQLLAVFLVAVPATPGQLMIVTKSSILNGITFTNEAGEEIGYCVATEDEKLNCGKLFDGITIGDIPLVNAEGTLIGTCKKNAGGIHDCGDLGIIGIPSYIYDGSEEEPDPDAWKPTKADAIDNCVTCHADKKDDKFQFANWYKKTSEYHKKHDDIEFTTETMCMACHIKD